jgi:hypothetical protein
MVSGAPKGIIAIWLLSMLSDHLSDNSKLRDIERDLEDVGIECNPDQKFVGSQRRSLFQGYYNSLDFTSPVDARRFLDVLHNPTQKPTICKPPLSPFTFSQHGLGSLAGRTAAFGLGVPSTGRPQLARSCRPTTHPNISSRLSDQGTA